MERAHAWSVDSRSPRGDLASDRSPESAAADVVLDLVREVVSELHPGHPGLDGLTLDSELDRDLGLDSLGRVELLTRVERVFSVSLSEQVVSRVQTPADLVLALRGAARGQTAIGGGATALAAPSTTPWPHHVRSLVEVLEFHAAAHPERPHVHLLGEGEERQTLTYGDLLAGSRRVAAGLMAHGIQPREQVAIMLPTSAPYLVTFLGTLIAGAVPVPIYPPARPAQIEDHLRRHAAILDNACCVALVTVREARGVARLLKSLVPSLRTVFTTDQLAPDAAAPVLPRVEPTDTAMLQYTSGSTGQPKGVVLNHANLLANIRAMGHAAQVSADDVMVSWLPLYHDMGLIGAWLCSLYYALPLVLMSPLSFLVRPERWLWAIHRYRGTIAASPNFGYELCVRKIEGAEVEGLDLGSWRLALNGAEPVSARTLERFAERFARHGFRRSALAPVYGLAESAVGLAFPPMGRGPLIDRVAREAFVREGRAVPIGPEVADGIEHVACGRPLREHQIRIVDATGREVPERQEGRLQFRGPSSTTGYFHNPRETSRLFDGEWLESGDLGYMARGDVYLTGRIKDLIIRAGRHLHPQELEEAVGDLAGVRKGCVVAFASADASSGTEQLIVLAETREADPEARRALHQRVQAVVTDVLGVPADRIVLAPPHTVLKTSSGKLRRAATRQAHERGMLGAAARAPWLQVLRLTLASAGPRLLRARRTLAALAFGLWSWLAFAIVAGIGWLPLLLLPRLSWRWGFARLCARVLARLTATPVDITGLEQLPPGPCVLVCNHQSHLDGFALIARLPLRFAFVAKAELSRNPWARLPLDRLGVQYVERFDPRQGIEGARRLGEQARAGRSLLFFPEGTHSRMQGLLPFHVGAFSTAAAAALPLVPVLIEGTRSILRSGSWFPGRGAIRIVVGPRIEPSGADFAAATRLNHQARAWMLATSGEPDLT